jgi:hypothetical protein
LAEAACGTPERPLTRDREENSEITPLHRPGWLQTKLNEVRTIVLLPMRASRAHVPHCQTRSHEHFSEKVEKWQNFY